MKQLVLTLLLLTACVQFTHARKTTRRGLKVNTETVKPPSAVNDTIIADSSAITYSGYDKPLRTVYETMLLTNHLTTPVKAIELHLEYYDLQGRMLHSRKCWIHIAIPSGETRLAKIRSWDTQQSFYYHRSRRPRNATATPYTVRSGITRVILDR